jgi:hypothetical protein
VLTLLSDDFLPGTVTLDKGEFDLFGEVIVDVFGEGYYLRDQLQHLLSFLPYFYKLSQFCHTYLFQ